MRSLREATIELYRGFEDGTFCGYIFHPETCLDLSANMAKISAIHSGLGVGRRFPSERESSQLQLHAAKVPISFVCYPNDDSKRIYRAPFL